jgi:CelD/BcsL family acetyltransferase involved in cellulose biosynthesis
MIRLELLDDCDEQAWDDLVATFEGGTIFHTLAWMRVIEELKRAEKLPFGIFDGADMVGVLPLFRVRRGPLMILASPLGSVGYGGPLVGRLHHQAVMAQLDGLLKHIRVDYVEFRSTEEWDPTLLFDRNYTVRELQTHVLSLDRDPEELWSSLSRTCRKSVRKARKSDVEIVEATDNSFLDVYYAMSKDTYRKSSRLPPLSLQDHVMVLDTLRPYDRVKVLLARHGEQVIAGIIVLCSRGKIYGWDAAALQSHYGLCPNNLLHWSLIEWGASNGFSEYDMMGANIPSIARFKRSFGGELQSYTYAYKDVTLPAYVGRRLYRWLVPQIRRIKFRLRPV